MTSELGADRWQRIEDILDAALAGTPAEWGAVLDASCGDDLALRKEVESLLRQTGKAATFLAEPPVAAAAAAIQDDGERHPPRHGDGRRSVASRVVREIGRGEMSRVFLAERADGGFAHRVAVKLLRPGLDTEM